METQKGQLTDAELTALKQAIKEHYEQGKQKRMQITTDDVKAWADSSKPKNTKR